MTIKVTGRNFRRGFRYLEIVPMDKLEELKIAVVGVGAIGRQVSIQLAAMGAMNIKLIDFDKVDVVNLGPQGYYPNDIGLCKVDATGRELQSLNHDIKVGPIPRKWNQRDTGNTDVVFMCVDSIDVRNSFASKAPPNKLYIDGRMAAEAFRVLTVQNGDFEYYNTTLFKSKEAYKAPCTAKSTIYCASIAAGFMVSQLTKYLRGFPLVADFCVNILGLTLHYENKAPLILVGD